eukprot:scpid60029/ scgid22005/ 
MAEKRPETPSSRSGAEAPLLANSSVKYDEQQPGATRAIAGGETGDTASLSRVGEDTLAGLTSTRKQLILGMFVVIIAATQLIIMSLGPFFTNEALSKNPDGGPGYHSAVGAVYSSKDITGLISVPAVTYDLENIGSRYLTVLCCATLSASHMIFAFVDSIQDWRVFITYSISVRLMQGAAQAALRVTVTAYLMRLFPTRMAVVTTFNNAAWSGAHALGTLLGGAFFDLVGYRYTFVIFSLTMGVCAIAAFFVMVDVERTKRGDRPCGSHAPADGSTTTRNNGETSEAADGSVSTLMKLPWVWLMCGAMVLSNMAYSGNEALLGPQMKHEFSSSATVIGAAISTQIILIFVLSPVVGWVLDRGCNATLTVIIGLALVGVACLLIGPSSIFHTAPSLWLVFLSMVPFGVGHIFMTIGTFCSLSESVENSKVGSVRSLRVAISGVTCFSLGLGYGAGPLLMSALVAKVGFATAFSIVSIVYFAYAALVIICSWARSKNNACPFVLWFEERGSSGSCSADSGVENAATELLPIAKKVEN